MATHEISRAGPVEVLRRSSPRYLIARVGSIELQVPRVRDGSFFPACWSQTPR